MSSPKEPAKTSEQKTTSTKRDKFIPFLVAFAVLSLIGVGIAIYLYWHKAEKKELPESYLALPEMVIDSDTQVVRLKVAVQVDAKDHEWAQKNNLKINQIFKESIQNIDTDRKYSDLQIFAFRLFQ